MDRQQTLAALHYPFTTPVNTQAATAQQHTEAWVATAQLLPDRASLLRFRAAQFGLLAACTAPTLPLEPLLLLADWCSWFFLHDDQCDEHPLGATIDSLPLWHARMLVVLHGADLAPLDSPLIRALANLRARTLPYGDAAAWQRYCAQLAQYFSAGEWEAANRAANRVPDLAAYRAMRPLTGGLYAYVELLTMLHGWGSANLLATLPGASTLTEQAILVISVCNDLVSLERELMHQDVHNLVMVLQAHRGLSRAQALTQTLDLHNATIAAFVAQARRLGASGATATKPAYHAYVRLLHAMIRGSFDWTCITTRHQPMEDERAVGDP